MCEHSELTVRGWQVVRLSTDEITADVVPALGGSIISLRRRSDDAELLWQTPWGLRPAESVRPPGNSEAQMVDRYPGGWHSLFPNGGDTAIVHGTEWGFDGEARLSWFDHEFADGTLTLTTRLIRSPFRMVKTITLDGSEITISETITNEGGDSLEVMWGQQIVLGPPLLGPRTSIDVPATVVHPDPKASSGVSYDDMTPWPRAHGGSTMINLRSVPGPDSGENRLAYLTDLTRAQATVSNLDTDLGVDLTWDGQSWPHLWYALEAGKRTGFPWFSRGYFLALSPNSSWPAHGVHDARRIGKSTIWIEPDETRTASVTLRVHTGAG